MLKWIQNTTKKKRSQRRSQATGQNYYGLESRQMLAVTVLQSGGELQIRGDHLDNTVEVSTLNAGNLRVTVQGEGAYDFASSGIDLIRFTGGNGDDVFTNLTDLDTFATGNRGDDVLSTRGGNDRLYGGFGRDTISSTSGTNILNGLEEVDIITGGTGNDTIYGFEGNDVINGGAGDDYIVAGRGDDTVNAGDGDDTVFGFFGNDVIHGNAGNDRLFAQQDDDRVYGDEGDDHVRGGDGVDWMEGNDGNDFMLGDEGNDSIYGGDGSDRIFGSDDADMIFGGADRDFLYAGGGDDTVYGGSGDDQIRGDLGNDRLFGEAGKDRIGADAGNDYIEGGSEYDTIFGNDGEDEIVGSSADSVNGGGGDDTIRFSQQLFDRAAFNGNFGNFKITESGSTLYVNDTVGSDGIDTIMGAEFLQFRDGIRDATTGNSQRVRVQPIIVSNNDGSNTAGYFGDEEQTLETKRLVDEIYLQANIDVEWLAPRNYNNTFANVGFNGSGVRDPNDLFDIAEAGDQAGVGHADALVIDMYFVETSAGFSPQGNNVANGLAFLGGNGITIHIGDELAESATGRAVTAQVTAHEIAHNLGLDHLSDPDNLMGDGTELTSSQRNMIRNSQYAVQI